MIGGKVEPGLAWAAAREAVAELMGAMPPGEPLRDGRRQDRAAAWRRGLAIYTAAVSLNVGVKPLLPHLGIDRRSVRKVLSRLEDRRDLECIDGLLDLLRRDAERRLARADRVRRVL